ncbi:hypothetical protein [Plebeiibacterium sediminum]|uniref:Uncharacterized protein n=1 Tax=Plebeiibacterium sediminum TaxID=2992112 RepID=A0AAE3SFP6_9BACT|nr:hypothetical protein [Plebeiobacterium sediminum]MCW3787695.1 hypothetical protein [Plebeiobacterium sediminum]
MKTYTKILCLVALSFFVYSCEKGRPIDVGPDSDDSDAPGWVGGDKDLNDHRNQNDDTQVVKGDDYGDLYVLARHDDGVPYMGSLLVSGEQGDEIVWYPLVLAYDVDGKLVSSTNTVDGLISVEGVPYLVFDVNSEGEMQSLNSYFPKEVEFGRINLIRSPNSVLANGLAEAISTLTDLGEGDYITTDGSGRLVAVHGEEDWLINVDEEDDNTIDSPRENMAIYKELMQNGFDGELGFLLDEGNTIAAEDLLLLAASAYAAGSDKTGTVLKDEIAYTNGFMEAYNAEDVIALTDFYAECDDSYYKNLMFYNFRDYEYDRENTYRYKWIKVTTLDGQGSYNVDVFSILDKVIFSEKSSGTVSNLEGFTMACDDAVQVLEFIHESDLIEYVGESTTKPSL